jgi:4-amino-4-deoxy-L-arabinose transferase-like glycosyltransferase
VIVCAELAYFAVTQPIYSPIDELHHFFYINHLYFAHQPPRVGLWFETTTDPAAPRERAVLPAQRGGAYTDRSYQATEGIQPWGYYGLMLPIFATGTPGTYDQIVRVRLATAALAALIVPFTFLLARVATPSAPWVWGAASVLPALSRGYTFNMSQVTNDPFAIVVGGAAALVFLWLARARLDWRWGLVAGVTAGLALIAKVTVYFVPVVLAALFLVRAVRGGPKAGRLAAALAGALTAAAIAGPWFAWHIATYGRLVPINDFANAPEALLQYRNLPIWRTVELWIVSGSLKFWVGETFAERPPVWLLAAGQLGLTLGLLGFLRRPVWKDPAAHALRLVAVWLAAGLVLLMTLLLLTSIPILVGRYAYPLFAPLAVVFAAGAYRLGRNGRWLYAGSALLLGVATLIAVSNTITFLTAA